MPGGGTLTIAACGTTDRKVHLSFGDTGIGMSAEVLAHACEPFYSTKGEHGTGLGLAICQQIIDRHQGAMQLESTPGVGTTVTVEFLQAYSTDLPPLALPESPFFLYHPLNGCPRPPWSERLLASGAGRPCKAGCTMAQRSCNLNGLARQA